MNGTAEQQLAILQNAEVHGKFPIFSLFYCVFEVLLCLLQKCKTKQKFETRKVST